MRFYLFDRITAFTPGRHACGIKNVSAHEEFLIGHYTHRPVMPAPLVVESLAQLGGWAVTVSGDYRHLAVMVKISGLIVKGEVSPGDRIDLEVTLEAVNEFGATVSGRAAVNGSAVVTVSGITYVLYTIPESEQDSVRERYTRLAAAENPGV